MYVLLEGRLVQLFKAPEDYEVLAKYTGKQLEGTRYTPIFDYFKQVTEYGEVCVGAGFRCGVCTGVRCGTTSSR